jgi:hydrogenase nickel incorporation protein HypA/HybF
MLFASTHFGCYGCVHSIHDNRGFPVHELAIAESLLEIVLEEGRRHDLQKVNVIRLQIGALAAVIPEALTFSFEMVSSDTIASGATLKIETLPIVARCSACDVNFEVENQVFLCLRCGQPVFELISGRELSMVSMEGETRDGDGGS